MNKKFLLPTFIGLIALILWSTTPFLVLQVKTVPTFEFLSLTSLVCFILTFILFLLRNDWQKLKQPLILWIVGIVGVCGNEIAYVNAYKIAPAGQIALIIALWPSVVMFFSSFLPGEKFYLRGFISCLCVLLAIYLGFGGFDSVSSFKINFWTGYFAAFLSVLIWSFFTITSKFFSKAPIELIGMYFGVSALTLSLLHWHYEPSYVLTPHQWLIIITMGLTCSGPAYFFWDYGIKHGNIRILSLLANFMPLMTLAILMLAKEVSFSLTLILAFCFVVLSTLVGLTRTRKAKSQHVATP